MIWLVIILAALNILLWSGIFYKQFFKRFYDVLLSGLALVFLSPLMVFLIVLGFIKMKGNPFFTQERPGKDEKIFKLVKFRSMTSERDSSGNLLPDDKRLNQYGKVLRLTSLDELPELWNILKGDMSIVGPRPLLVRYLPYFTDKERHRHDVRPGITGWAQVNGRNFITWEETFSYDLEYVRSLSLLFDLKIILTTIKKVFLHSDITDATQGTEDSSGRHVHDALDIERGGKNDI